jgi:DNA-binding NtrC family response regulator
VEQAGGGTLFFDELGDMPLSVQADLLRFLQTRRFRPLGSDEEVQADVRLVAAAQPCLHEKIEKGEFRADLYFRIAEVELTTPRLAEVPEDIIRIVRNIVYRCREGGKLEDSDRIRETIDYFSRGQAILQACPWPGNVRELARHIRRRLFLGDDVIPEIARIRPSVSADRDGHYPIFRPIRRAEDIAPLGEIVTHYVRHVWAHRGQLTQQEVATRLDLSVNTLKKHIPWD